MRPELLNAKGNTFEIDPLLQRQVVFLRHDMVKDQPFPQCDLIVCRNALIYYNQETQKLLLDRFSGALRPGGVLFLGAPEVSTAHGSAIRPMRGTSRFLENTREERADETESAAPLPTSEREGPVQGPRLSLTRQDGAASLVMAEMPDILRHLGAAVFVLNEEGDIQRTFGDYERFIEVPRSRTFTSNLLDLLPDPLSVNVALLMRKAAAGKVRMPGMDPGEHLPSRQVEGLCHITSSSDGQTTYIITLNNLRTGPAHSLSGLDADASTGGHDTMDEVLLKAEIASLHDKLAETVQDLQDIYAERQVMEARLLVAETELAERHEEIGNLTDELQVARSGSDGPDNYAGFLFGAVADVLTLLDLGMSLADCQLRLSQFNAAFAELLSLGEKDIGRQMDEVIRHVPQADRLAFNAALLQSALHDKPATFLFEGRDGVRYRVTTRPLSDLVGPILS